MCTSLATCSYYGLNLASTASLNVAGCRLFQSPYSSERISNPLLISAVTKALSLVPYYLSSSVQQKYSNPFSGAGYPGVFAIASGYVSKRTSQQNLLSEDTATVLISSITSFFYSMVLNHFPPKTFCDPQLYNTTSPPKSNRSTYGFSTWMMLHVAEIVLVESGHHLMTDKVTRLKQFGKNSFLIYSGAALVPKLISTINTDFKVGLPGLPIASISLPMFTGMLAGHMNNEGQRRVFKILTSSYGTILAASVIKLSAMKYCFDCAPIYCYANKTADRGGE